MKNLIQLVIASTLGLASTVTPAFADTTCTPDIKVTYVGGHGTSVKIVAIEYSLDGTSQPHREDVGNTVLTKGQSKTFKSQRLGSVAKGQKLDLKAIFRADNGKGFGDEQKGTLRNSGKECENNVTYSLNVE
jgi:hypothetical protein